AARRRSTVGRTTREGAQGSAARRSGSNRRGRAPPLDVRAENPRGLFWRTRGGVTERPKVRHWKCRARVIPVPRVQIPPPPPTIIRRRSACAGLRRSTVGQRPPWSLRRSTVGRRPPWLAPAPDGRRIDALDQF